MIDKGQHLTSVIRSSNGDDEEFDADPFFNGAHIRKGLSERSPNMAKPKLQKLGQDEPLYKRLNQEAVAFEEHNKQLKEYYSREEVKGCSFVPKLITEQLTDKRSLYQFLNDQQNHVQRVENKVEQIKKLEKERNDQYSFHPQTNDYEPMNRDKNVPIYERLYNLKKNASQQQISQSLLQEEPQQTVPQISAVSKQIVRNENVEEILYKDAQRRLQKQKQNEQQNKTKTVQVNMKFTSNNSEKIVAQKFIREFENTVDQIFDETGQDRPSTVSYSIDYLKLGEILQRLNFISEPTTCKSEKAIEFENLRLAEERALLCEVWTTLRGDKMSGISKRNLCLFLLTLIGITDFKLKELPQSGTNQNGEAFALTKDDHEHEIKPVQHIAHQPDKQKLGSIDTEGNLIFSFEESRRIQKTFDVLYRNRLGQEQLKKTQWTDTNSYKPEVLPQSQQLANKYREKLLEETAALIDGDRIKVSIPENGQITHADLLVLQKKTQEYTKELKKKQFQEKQMENCTFHPQLIAKNNSFSESRNKGISKAIQLYQMAKPTSQKRDRTKEEIEFERQQEDCTFTPDLQKDNVSKQSQNDQTIIARDVDKTVQRMRDARKKREQVQQMLDRGYNQPERTNKNSLSVKNLKQSNLPTYPSQQVEEPIPVQHNNQAPLMNHDNNQTQDRVPLLFVDVNLGPGKTERIIVFEGDHSSDLATKFAQEHGLDDFMRDKLKELLDYQISGLLTKIDEEMPSVNSDGEN